MRRDLLLLSVHLVTAISVLASCGGDSGGAGSSTKYTLGGSINGLIGAGLILSDSGQPTPKTVAGQAASLPMLSSNFSFEGGVPYLSAATQYNVIVQQQPTGGKCSVSNGTGTAAANVSNVAVTCVSPWPHTVVGSTDYANVTGELSRVFGASSVTVDRNGSVYVVDRVSGKLLSITQAGSFSALRLTDGLTGAPIPSPGIQQVTVDAVGNIYVAANPSGVGAVIQTVTQSGLVTTLAGSGAEGSTDGVGAAASFSGWIKGLAVDRDGNIYVGDYGYGSPNNKIRKVTPAGVVSTLAGSGAEGSSDGAGATASFNLGGAKGNVITVDSNGNVYVVEWLNEDVRKITPSGVVSTFAGGGGRFGGADGAGVTEASFSNPIGIAVDDGENVYVLDGSNSIRMIMPSGMVSTLVTSNVSALNHFTNVAYQGGVALNCIASSTNGTLYIATSGADTEIRRIDFPAPRHP